MGFFSFVLRNKNRIFAFKIYFDKTDILIK